MGRTMEPASSGGVQSFRELLLNNPGARAALRVAGTAAVCAWGPSAPAMLATGTGKKFVS